MTIQNRRGSETNLQNRQGSEASDLWKKGRQPTSGHWYQMFYVCRIGFKKLCHNFCFVTPHHLAHPASPLSGSRQIGPTVQGPICLEALKPFLPGHIQWGLVQHGERWLFLQSASSSRLAVRTMSCGLKYFNFKKKSSSSSSHLAVRTVSCGLKYFN